MDGWNTSSLLGWPIFSGYVRLFQLLQFEAASSEGFKSSRQIARTSCTSGHVGAPNSAYGSWQGREQRFHRPAVLNNSFVSLEVELNRTTNSNGKVEDNSGVQIIKKKLCNCQMINLYASMSTHHSIPLSLSVRIPAPWDYGGYKTCIYNHSKSPTKMNGLMKHLSFVQTLWSPLGASFWL